MSTQLLTDYFDNKEASAIEFTFRRRAIVIYKGIVKTLTTAGSPVTVSDTGIEKLKSHLHELTDIYYTKPFNISDYLTVEEYKHELDLFVKEGVYLNSTKTPGYIVGLMVPVSTPAW